MRRSLRCAAVLLFLSGTLVTGAVAAPSGKVVERRGYGSVCLVKYENGVWQLLVSGEPYIVRGLEYSPDAVGRTPQESNEWMRSDTNRNTACDGPYDAWIDENKDDYQDADEENVGDFKLLKDMGCNTIRIYHPENLDKEILRELYNKHGIRIIMGNFFGAYTKGSEADWESGTDYTDAQQREKMKESVRRMVMDFKDEPYVLMWMLGNENDVTGSYENSTYNNTNAAQKPEAYTKFLSEVVRMIKKLDPDHPVGVSNAYTRLLPYYAKYAPEVDVVGMNSYSGPFGFSTLWNRVKTMFDRPVLITEYGCDAYNEKKGQEDEAYQAEYHRRAWQDIEANSFLGDKAGNALGGVIFTWLDKWWVCNAPSVHDIEPGKWKGPKTDGYFHDEWMGICGQGDGSHSPYQRQPRKVYYLYRDALWKNFH